jgi:hypothetical protein
LLSGLRRERKEKKIKVSLSSHFLNLCGLCG